MPNVTIKGDPRMAAAIAEGVNAAELRMVNAEFRKLKARDGVRAEGDEKRWQRQRRRLARKYATKPMNPVYGAILGVWGLLWLGIYSAVDYLSAWNRRA